MRNNEEADDETLTRLLAFEAKALTDRWSVRNEPEGSQGPSWAIPEVVGA